MKPIAATSSTTTITSTAINTTTNTDCLVNEIIETEVVVKEDEVTIRNSSNITPALKIHNLESLYESEGTVVVSDSNANNGVDHNDNSDDNVLDNSDDGDV